MTDFQRVIDFLFVIMNKLWAVIRLNYLLGFSMMVVFLSWILTILSKSKGDK